MAAEQDRYGARFSPGQDNIERAKDAAERAYHKIGDKVSSEAHHLGHYVGLEQSAIEKARSKMFGSSGTSGAEQDTWAGYFSIGNDGLERARRVAGAKGVGAEQDRYGQYFQGPDNAAQSLKSNFKSAAGELEDTAGRAADKTQDIAGRAADKTRDATGRAADTTRDAFRGASGSEQDRYGQYFKGTTHPSEHAEHAAARTKDAFHGTAGAEQDRYGAHFEPAASKLTDNARNAIKSFENDQYQRRADFNRTGTFSPSDRTAQPLRTATIGILESTILPSLSFHSSLAALAYGVARYTNRLDVKDFLWPTAQVANAWYSAVGRHLLAGVPLSVVWNSISYGERALLTGVTAWGARLLYRIATRSIDRGTDDARYIEAKKEPDFWNKAAWSIFLPEALFQTVISLPFVLPFRDVAASAALTPAAGFAEFAHIAAIFLFGTGFALETLADSQLNAHKEAGDEGVNKRGVWSIVRHPNYLGDTLIHASFPILLYSTGLLHPAALLGPIANYVFLRYIGGTKQTEKSQAERYAKGEKAVQLKEYKETKNAFWPRVEEGGNRWVWVVAGLGALAVGVERGVREVLLHETG